MLARYGEGLALLPAAKLVGYSGALPQEENNETNEWPPAQKESPMRLLLLAGSCCVAAWLRLHCMCPVWAPVPP